MSKTLSKKDLQIIEARLSAHLNKQVAIITQSGLIPSDYQTLVKFDNQFIYTRDLDRDYQYSHGSIRHIFSNLFDEKIY